MYEPKLIFILLFSFCLVACDSSNERTFMMPIDEYLILLESEPNNCFALDQVARDYSVNQQCQTAIGYFEKVMVNCPGYVSSRFQMGICYLFINDIDKGILAMDRAILDVEAEGDKTWANTLKGEKELWLKSIESIGSDTFLRTGEFDSKVHH